MSARVRLFSVALVLVGGQLPLTAAEPADPSPTGHHPAARESRQERASVNSSLPLRWQIVNAANVGVTNPQAVREPGDPECVTNVVAYTSTMIAGAISVDFEFFDHLGNPIGLVQKTNIFPGRVTGVQSDVNAASSVLRGQPDAETGDFSAGSVLVFAEDPRVFPSAFLVCRWTDGREETIPLPAFPVGATLDYFRAGTPAPLGPVTGIEVPREK